MSTFGNSERISKIRVGNSNPCRRYPSRPLSQLLLFAVTAKSRYSRTSLMQTPFRPKCLSWSQRVAIHGKKVHYRLYFPMPSHIASLCNSLCSSFIPRPHPARISCGVYIYRYQYNAGILKAICAGVGFGPGPRICLFWSDVPSYLLIC